MIEQVKKQLTPDQIQTKHIRSMSNRQMSGRLKNLARQRNSNIDNLWAAVLSIVFHNTLETGGKMEPYLR